MSSISDDSVDPDAAVLAVLRLLRQRLDMSPLYGGEIDELLRSFAEMLLIYRSETVPTLVHALERAQKAPLPGEVLAELMAAGAKIDTDRMSTVRGICDLNVTEGERAQAVRQAIAGVEHMNDAARELTKRTERLLEEFDSTSV